MKHICLVIAILITALMSCDKRPMSPSQPIHDEMNSVYYWKTVFDLDSADKAFISRHNVGRIYLRMFDVTADNYGSTLNEKAIPNASVRIDYSNYHYLTDSFKDTEFVPVVYITLDALETMMDHEGMLASNIVSRVKNMCSYNGMTNVSELQLDCDWTYSTDESFFSLCDSVRLCLAEHNLPWRLSSTIRLHQLSDEAPPVDNGVLMVYNTGSFNNPDARNSIIDIADVEPYLRHLSSYPLHLDIAYPTYSWQLVFRHREFYGLTNGLNLSDTTQFSAVGTNLYSARRDIVRNGKVIRQGDIVRSETSDYNDIIKVKNLIERCLAGRPHSNILYHLDSKNLSNYASNEIDNLFATGL